MHRMEVNWFAGENSKIIVLSTFFHFSNRSLRFTLISLQLSVRLKRLKIEDSRCFDIENCWSLNQKMSELAWIFFLFSVAFRLNFFSLHRIRNVEFEEIKKKLLVMRSRSYSKHFALFLSTKTTYNECFVLRASIISKLIWIGKIFSTVSRKTFSLCPALVKMGNKWKHLMHSKFMRRLCGKVDFRV